MVYSLQHKALSSGTPTTPRPGGRFAPSLLRRLTGSNSFPEVPGGVPLQVQVFDVARVLVPHQGIMANVGAEGFEFVGVANNPVKEPRLPGEGAKARGPDVAARCRLELPKDGAERIRFQPRSDGPVGRLFSNRPLGRLPQRGDCRGGGLP